MAVAKETAFQGTMGILSQVNVAPGRPSSQQCMGPGWSPSPQNWWFSKGDLEKGKGRDIGYALAARSLRGSEQRGGVHHRGP
jgi:hypothetical protein